MTPRGGRDSRRVEGQQEQHPNAEYDDLLGDFSGNDVQISDPHGSNFDDTIHTLQSLGNLDQGIETEINGEKITLVVPMLCYLGDIPRQDSNSGFRGPRAYHYRTVEMRRKIGGRYMKRTLILTETRMASNRDFTLID
ncbi:hypothetical protein B0T25DRAFT_563398 [Lasiosphaeria hispida]|uniref:Uncharacterized protein n=1 Tax=Lasiosphaeria hispida TaxID=260671 RepID=A0AAJ0HXD5_9PEZI|nr:hypothetical protein B0T25DRAFT_563398 [Lasiosphaeria hispida]